MGNVKILVINAGSSSIKYCLFGMSDDRTLVTGIQERIGDKESTWRQRHYSGTDRIDETERHVPVPDHAAGLRMIAEALVESGAIAPGGDLAGVGHRVVHGGESFRQPVVVDDEVLDRIRAKTPLAPLHNAANVTGIEIAGRQFPGVPQVAVFDTAFHQTMPPHAFRYALPDTVYRDFGVRRYGFHGTSHGYVAKRAAKYLGRPLDALNLITLHLGNGASATAIRHGVSVDTSMGMTPLEGLMMGTRCGDIDPALPLFLVRATGGSINDVENLLNDSSGLAGVGGAGDMREIHRRIAAGDPDARLALDMFCYRIRKYIGAYIAVLGRIDALVFTAGIGEHDATVREMVCDGLAHLGIRVHDARNREPGKGIGEIQDTGAALKILVIPTNEEYEIARQTLNLIKSKEEREEERGKNEIVNWRAAGNKLSDEQQRRGNRSRQIKGRSQFVAFILYSLLCSLPEDNNGY